MKTIRVQYTVNEDFVSTNKENIAAVMSELREIANPDVRYTAYQHEDGKTFMHVVTYANTEAESLPASLDSFKEFQKQLKENLEIPPKVENFTLVDSSIL